jgi:urea transport system ATP-binding protein
VFENLELALKAPRGPFACLRWVLRGEARSRVEATLEEIGLTARVHDRAAILSHGQRQWLEIGMLLMQDPELLLVDEPVAGMTDQETEHTAALLRRIAGRRSVVVVEHDLEFVRALGRKVTVLHEGSVLSEGPIDQVQEDPRVVEVYLGR